MQQKLIINHLSSVICRLSSVLGTSTYVERSLQISPFYAKQTQFPKKSNERKHISENGLWKYKRLDTWLSGKNKPNSNPIKPNFQKAKMNVNLYIIEDYRKKDDFIVRINKPNSNPIFVKPKMSANLYVIEDYENETAFRPKKTNPIQTQSWAQWVYPECNRREWANFFKGQNRLPENLATPEFDGTLSKVLHS